MYILLGCFYNSCLQKDAMEDSMEIVIEKLLHVTKDAVPKVFSFSLLKSFFLDYAFLIGFGVSMFRSLCRYQLKLSTA